MQLIQHSLPWGSTITQSKHPLSTDSSDLHDLYGYESWSEPSFYPPRTFPSTLASTEVCLVQVAICWAVTGESLSCSTNSTTSAGTVTVILAGTSGSSTQLNASALACCWVFLHLMVFSYEASFHAHLWIRLAACWNCLVLAKQHQEWFVICLEGKFVTIPKTHDRASFSIWEYFCLT